MSTDLTSLKPAGAQLPAAFQGKKAAQVFQGKDLEKGSEGIEGSYPIIKFGGKVWSLQYRGENRKFMRPDGDGPRGSLDVIFVRTATNKAKTFYPPGFKEGSKEKPICWSNDGAKPDPAVPPSQRPAPACAACPKNVFGSRVTDDGKQAKACGDHKRTAIIVDPALVVAVLGMPLSEPALLRIPAASLNDFSTFCDTMAAQSFPIQTFVCKISFDTTKTFPKFVFEAIRPLSDEEGLIVLAFRDDPLSVRIISEGVAVNDGADDGAVAGMEASAPVTGPNLGAGQAPSQGSLHQSNGVSVNQTVQGSQSGVVVPLNVAQGAQSGSVVPLNVAPRPEALNPNPPKDVAGPTIVQTDRPTPEQQAQQMAQQQEQAAEAGTTDFDADINDRISKLLG